MDKPEHRNGNRTSSGGITRRQFLKNAGFSTVGVTVASTGLLERIRPPGAAIAPGRILGPGAFELALTVNGKQVRANVEPRMTLADVLRDHLGLTGTKIGCDRGACGACTVIVDGLAVTSCMTLAIDARGKSIETIEGLARSEDALHTVQSSFIEYDALQCGFCTSGMIMSCKSLLDANPNPSEEEIRMATSGNLCRCGTYPKVFEAVKAASGSAG